MLEWVAKWAPQELDYTLDQLKKLKADRSELARWRKKLDEIRATERSMNESDCAL